MLPTPRFLTQINKHNSVIGTLNPPKYQQRLYISHSPKTTKFNMVNNFAVQSITKPSQILRQRNGLCNVTKKGTNLDKLTPRKENIKLRGHYISKNLKYLKVNRADGTTDIVSNISINNIVSNISIIFKYAKAELSLKQHIFLYTHKTQSITATLVLTTP